MELDKIIGGKCKRLDVEDIRKLSPEEVEKKILQLQAHNDQLRSIISKQNQIKSEGSKTQKPFNFSRCRKTHILLKLLYLGWDYQGYCVQEDTSVTVEHQLMGALLKCRLIESRHTSNYHRCGRTDKGVTSFSQVISITVRASDKGKPDLEYCKMLNRVLPEDIRALAWCPVDPGVSARFDCTRRIYRYFFPKADLDLEEMNKAAQFLVGTHDFRNLCKMDVNNGVTNFVRVIYSAHITCLEDQNATVREGYRMCQLELEGQAFLWHQVRCIMSILLSVGQHLEEPTIVQELLDIDKNPRKPQYPMAHHIGLNLFSCEFADDHGPWIVDKNELKSTVETLQTIWATNAIKCRHLLSMLQVLESGLDEPINVQSCGLLKRETKQYKPLLSRKTCNSLAERLEQQAKKQKLSSIAENKDIVS